MLRRLLSGVLLALLALVLIARLRELWQGRTPALAPPAAREVTLAGADHRTRAAVDFPGDLVPPLDSAARLTARLRLTGEPDRHYLDSLLATSDSIVRRWPLGSGVIGYAIVPGGAAGFLPEMVHDPRWAIDTWSPTALGLNLVEVRDTTRASLVVRWADTLSGDRAGFTDITWDRAGRIRHAEVYLATRSPNTGRPLLPETRHAVALHELGHALGLPHSSHREDVMFPVAEAVTPTDRDRFSLRLLYQLPTGWVGEGPVPPARGRP
jgi:Matrixin